MTDQTTQNNVPDLAHMAETVYIYGYPLVYNLREIGDIAAGSQRFPEQAPFNQFGHARKLAGPEVKFVSPNNDTNYSVATLDLRHGPLVLHVPETHGRYYVLQFVDAWTNNFAYVGSRATGTQKSEFLLAQRGYEGPIPEGMRVIFAPTSICAIVGRIQVNSEADLLAVRELQDQFTLTPLSVYQGGAAAPAPAGVPSPDPRVGSELLWWERFRVALAACPPPAADGQLLAAANRLGITAVESPYVNPDPALAEALIAGTRMGTAKIEEVMKNQPASPTGWQSAMHNFDYNLDYFELGTLDTPDWKISDRSQAYIVRAAAARGGLWGNHGYEATYEFAWIDTAGQPLTGENKYELHLTTPPPVDAFWSLTMYNVPDFYLVANPINRYSIGDRTPGLKQGQDGSVTIYLQKDSPGPEKESNWLPTPPDRFRPIMRLYAPQQAVLDGRYALPGIKRLA